MLTKPDKATSRLIESIDPSYYESLSSQIRYAIGEPWRVGNSSSGSATTLPYYDPPRLYLRKVGRSMKILSNAMVELSTVMDRDPEPKWTQVHNSISEARAQVFLSRWREFSWKSEFERAYLEMSLLGLGILEWGIDIDPESGLQYAACRHSPLVQTLKDAHEPDPGKWRYVGFVKYMAPEDALALYGAKAKKKIESSVVKIDSDGYREAVRVIEYWDRGYGPGDPSHMVFIGDVGGEVIVDPEPNPFGNMLPFSYGENVLFPGFKHHCGRIIMQMAEQEARNKIEQAMFKTAQDHGMDVVNTERIDKEEFEKAYREGRTRLYAKSSPPNMAEPAVERIPARELSSTALQMIQDLDKQLNAMSGVTDLERGSLTQQDRTLGEIQLLDARSQSSRARIIRQTMLFYVRSINAWARIAAKYDEYPARVDVFGSNMVFNDVDDPRSALKYLFEEPSEVVISSSSLSKQDDDMKRQVRLQRLLLLRGDPLVNQQKLLEEILETIGEDPAEFIAQAQPVDPAAALLGGASAPGAQGSPAGVPQSTVSNAAGVQTPLQGIGALLGTQHRA